MSIKHFLTLKERVPKKDVEGQRTALREEAAARALALESLQRERHGERSRLQVLLGTHISNFLAKA